MDRPTPTGPAAPELRIVESRVYRGGNIWSYEPAVHLVVDLGVLEGYPTDTLPGFTDRLLELLPGLGEPHLLQGRPGRLRRAAARGHLAGPRRGARRSPAPAGGRARPAPGEDAHGQGPPRGLQRRLRLQRRGGRASRPGELAVRLVNHLVQARGGLRLRGRARALPHPRRAHGVRALHRRHPRGGGEPRHPLHPAQQRQPRPARPGRAPAAHPGDDDVEDQRAGRRHRG